MEAQNFGRCFSAPNSITTLSCKHSQACFVLPVSSRPQSNKLWAARKSHCLSYSSSSCEISHSKPLLNEKGELSTLCAVNTDMADSEISARRKNLAVFVSGEGSNFKAIREAALTGLVQGDVVALVTNKSGCGGANYARDNGISVFVYPKTKEETEGLSADNLVALLRNLEVDFVLLAGYLKLIPVELVQAYPKRIINIHPSLLPAFGGKGYYGMKVHKAVIASGVRYSGPTIHFVDEQYDTGRILAQKAVPVLANDTPEELAARVLHQEHQLYVEVVAALCEDRVIFRNDGVPLIRSTEDPNKYF